MSTLCHKHHILVWEKIFKTSKKKKYELISTGKERHEANIRCMDTDGGHRYAAAANMCQVSDLTGRGVHRLQKLGPPIREQ